jgi:hypothetical protein
MQKSAKHVAYRYLYARLFQAMSLDYAKVVLGLPPGSWPSEAEVMKAWRQKAFENHPDRGGDLTKMVEVNVAKDVLLGKQRPTADRPPSPQPPPPPPAETTGPDEKPLFNEHSFEEAAKKANAPISNVYWQWVTEYQNFEPESFEVRRLGALDTGWVAYGQHENGDHVFLPIGTGMFHQLDPDELETWWVGKPVPVSRKVPTPRAVSEGMTKAVGQIKGLTKTNKIYVISDNIGRRYLAQKDIEQPKGSATTIQKWLEVTGRGKEVPFKLVIQLRTGPRGSWDKQVVIVINGHDNVLSPEATEDFRRSLGPKLFKKNQILYWNTSLDLTRMRNPAWAMSLLWRGFRQELAQADAEAFRAYLAQIGAYVP